MLINEYIFKEILKNKKILGFLLGMIENKNININRIHYLFLEPIGYDENLLKLKSIYILYEDLYDNPVLYSIELISEEKNNLLDYLNNEYVYLAKYRLLLGNANVKANDLEIKKIAFLKHNIYDDNVCVRGFKQYKASINIIEMQKYKYIDNIKIKEIIEVMISDDLYKYENRDDIMGIIARLIINENKNPRIIRELKQLEESKSLLSIKYQSGYQNGMNKGYAEGFIDGKNETLINIVLSLHKERIGYIRIAKILNLNKLEVLGIINNNKIHNFSLNK